MARQPATKKQKRIRRTKKNIERTVRSQTSQRGATRKAPKKSTVPVRGKAQFEARKQAAAKKRIAAAHKRVAEARKKIAEARKRLAAERKAGADLKKRQADLKKRRPPTGRRPSNPERQYRYN